MPEIYLFTRKCPGRQMLRTALVTNWHNRSIVITRQLMWYLPEALPMVWTTILFGGLDPFWLLYPRLQLVIIGVNMLPETFPNETHIPETGNNNQRQKREILWKIKFLSILTFRNSGHWDCENLLTLGGVYNVS